MDASRAADCYGCLPGRKTEIVDAVQAYIQTRLKGNIGWICLPPDRRPEGDAGLSRPVVDFRQTWYGHPDSGSFGEEHGGKYCQAAGCEATGRGSPST